MLKFFLLLVLIVLQTKAMEQKNSLALPAEKDFFELAQQLENIDQRICFEKNYELVKEQRNLLQSMHDHLDKLSSKSLEKVTLFYTCFFVVINNDLLRKQKQPLQTMVQSTDLYDQTFVVRDEVLKAAINTKLLNIDPKYRFDNFSIAVHNFISTLSSNNKMIPQTLLRDVQTCLLHSAMHLQRFHNSCNKQVNTTHS